MKELFVLILVALLCHVHSYSINPSDVKDGDEPKSYRLTNNFDVENYKVTIDVSDIDTDEEEKKFTGTVEIILKTKAETEIIELHVGKNIETIKIADVEITVLTKHTKVGVLEEVDEDGDDDGGDDGDDDGGDDGGDNGGDDGSQEEPVKIDPNNKFKVDAADIMKITLTKKVTADDRIMLRFKSYVAKYSDDMYGLYLSTYTEEDIPKKIATTQFQPTHARRVFPCLDEPQYKATFDITIKHTKDYKAISNQPEKQATDTETIFETTPRMSTYLVAFLVSNFEGTTVIYTDEKCGDSKPCESKIWTQKELAPNADYAVKVTPNILKKLNEFTGLNYWDTDIKKLDQIAIPDFSAGAMENWGLVTYRETALLIDPIKSTERNKQRVTSVIAHEFAHMWFGNMVTLNWWDYTWLNEGFARFFEYFITGLVYPDWNMDEQFVIEQIHSVFVSDGFKKSKPLNQVVITQEEIKAKFDSIGYNKGASVIRMLKYAVGEDKFDTAIRNYLNDNIGKNNVKPKQLYAVFDPEWAAFMESWTTQEGYPLISVSRKKAEADQQTIEVKQERFLYEQPKVKDQKKWQISLTYSTKKDESKSADEIMKDTNVELTIPKGDFLIFNLKQTGYYRVNYEGELLDELQKTLKENTSSIPVINRAQIVDDYMNFARAGKIDYVKAFEVISFLENEEEYLPWYAALNSFSFLRRRFADGNIRNSIDEQMQGLMKKVIGNIKIDSTKHFEVLKNVLILQWACEINEKTCVEKAKAMFDSYKQKETTTPTTTTPTTTPTLTPTSTSTSTSTSTTTTTTPKPETVKATTEILPSNLLGIVLCAGLRNSDKEQEDWEFVKGLLDTKTFPQEQATIVTALGCTKNEKHLEEYLQMTLDKNSRKTFRKQDKMAVFNAVLTGTPQGVDVAFKFLDGKLPEIRNNFQGLNDLSKMVNNVADRLTTQMEEFKTFLEKNKGTLEIDITPVLDMLETNQQWIETNANTLKNFYKKPDDGDGDGGAAELTISTFLLILTTFIIKNL